MITDVVSERVEAVVLGDIAFDRAYQGTPDPRIVRRIVEGFDHDILDPPVLNERADGSKFCLDGQHRVEALKELGEERAWCRIVTIPEADEPTFFRRINESRRRLLQFEKYRASLAARDPRYVEIEEVTTRLGYQIVSSQKWRVDYQLACVRAIEGAVDAHGIGCYEKALQTISVAWPNEENRAACRAEVITGLSGFYFMYPDEAVRVVGVKLARYHPIVILQRATALTGGVQVPGAGYAKFANAVTLLVSSGRRTNQLEWDARAYRTAVVSVTRKKAEAKKRSQLGGSDE